MTSENGAECKGTRKLSNRGLSGVGRCSHCAIWSSPAPSLVGSLMTTPAAGWTLPVPNCPALTSCQRFRQAGASDKVTR